MPAVTPDFFECDALSLAPRLLGKVLRRHWQGKWLAARIIETEAYLLSDKGSHASLGYTHARRALFMGGGTLYMYYARGGDSLNIGAVGEGNAVLIKSAYPWQDELSDESAMAAMLQLNPDARGLARPPDRLCAGQTLLCRSLALKVPDWNARTFDAQEFFLDDVGLVVDNIIQTTRLGIPVGRDETLPYRFVDADFARHCTRNPLRRGQVEGRDYTWLQGGASHRLSWPESKSV